MSKWDGVPLNSEKDGWHWLQESDLDPECVFWRSQPYFGDKRGRWEAKGTEDDFEPHEISTWRYLGPVATPEETEAKTARIAELEAALANARRDGMEAVAKWHDEQAAKAQRLSDMKVSAEDEEVWGDYAENHREYAAEIRAALTGGKNE